MEPVGADYTCNTCSCMACEKNVNSPLFVPGKPGKKCEKCPKTPSKECYRTACPDKPRW